MLLLLLLLLGDGRSPALLLPSSRSAGLLLRALLRCSSWLTVLLLPGSVAIRSGSGGRYWLGLTPSRWKLPGCAGAPAAFQ